MTRAELQLAIIALMFAMLTGVSLGVAGTVLLTQGQPHANLSAVIYAPGRPAELARSL